MALDLWGFRPNVRGMSYRNDTTEPPCVVEGLGHVWAAQVPEDGKARAVCLICSLRKVTGSVTTFWRPAKLQPQD